MVRTFRWALPLTALGLALAFVYGGTTALTIAAILGILEISLSFDNAVVNATVLQRLNAFWQRIFLTVGIAIAVFGMRLLFPLIVVGITAKLSPSQAIHLAMAKGDPSVSGTYGYLLRAAHPAIAAFGGMFLLMLFLDFIFEEREITWLKWIERPAARLGHVDQLSSIVCLVVLVTVAETIAGSKSPTVLASGALGIVVYLLVNGLGELFEADEDEAVEDLAGPPTPSLGRPLAAVGKASLFLFLYLEVLDASFSFDGVIGAFAITSDPILIALGLGIGAMYIRSLTVFLVRRGTISEYIYLEHGAHWAIGALACILLVTIKYDLPQVVTGLVGISFIALAFVSSLVRRSRQALYQPGSPVPAG